MRRRVLQLVANGLFEKAVNVSLFDTDKAISIVCHFYSIVPEHSIRNECSANIILNSESALF